MESVLIAKAHGLGNFLMATPAIKAIRDHHHDARITLYAQSNVVADVARGYPWIDKITTSASTLTHSDYDHGYFLNREIYTGNNRIKKVWVNGHSMADLCAHNKPHEVDSYIPDDIGTDDTELYCPVSSEEYIRVCIPDEEAKLVAMLPYAVNRPPFKTWTPWKWAKLSKRLVDAGYHPIFVGSEPGGIYDWKGDSDDLYAELKSLLQDHEFDWFCNATTIWEAIGIISQCSAAIAIDCGLMHVAEAMRVPTIALFGPTWDEKNGPRMHGKVVRSCEPCYPNQKCPEHGDTRKCMDLITDEEVFSRLDLTVNV